MERSTKDRQHADGPPTLWVPVHDVQFYATDQFLVDAVAQYLAEGVKIGQPIVIIATGVHRTEFSRRMCDLGVDVDGLVAGRDIVMLDASETLSSFMEGRLPSPELFDATVGNVFEKLQRHRPYLMVRAYGEMVDLLWREGKAEGAILLEQLWNKLSARYSFSLLCAYADTTVLAPAARTVKDICRAHSNVLPAESPARRARLEIQPS